MPRTLVLDCCMPFAPRPGVLSELVSGEILKLFQQHDVHATFVLSGLSLYRAAKSRDVISALVTLALDERIELACEPLGAPLPGAVSASDVAERLQLSRSWFREIFGIPLRTICLDPRYPCSDILSNLGEFQPEHVILLPIFPRRTLPRQSQQLIQLRGDVAISGIREMTSLQSVEQTVEILSLHPLSRLQEHERQGIWSAFSEWLSRDTAAVRSLREIFDIRAQELKGGEISELTYPVKKGEFPGGDLPAAQNYRARVAKLRADISRYVADTESGVENETRSKRLSEMYRYLAQADAGDGIVLSGAGGFFNPRTRETLYDGLLRAQVAFDSERRPDVDPNFGWVEVISPLGSKGEIRESLVIDTQLIRLFVDPLRGGALESFEYRPRKINLQCVLGTDGAVIPSLTERLVRIGPGSPPVRNFSIASTSISATVTQRSGAMVVSRFVDSVGGSDSLILQKDISVRGGIGAHLNNATTGFAVEYSVEDDQPMHPELHLVVQFALLLPCAEPSASSLYPLMCVGGVAPSRFSFGDSELVTSDRVPGGIYGARLIDTLQDFMMDIRASRPLWGIFFEPVYAGSGGDTFYQGSTLSLVLPCSRLRGGLSGFSVFVSIM